MLRSCSRLLASALLALTALTAWVETTLAGDLPFSRVYVFADSNLDNGNVFLFTSAEPNDPFPTFPPSPPYDNGRFSNGPLWVEVMAAELGLPNPGPSLAGGTDYAWGGATTGPGLSPFGTPNLGTQIDSFLAAEGSFHGDELIVLQAGNNDLNVARLPTFTALGLGAIANNFEDHITQLARAGGRYFLVTKLAASYRQPTLARTPYGNRLRHQFDALNKLLERTLTKLAKKLGVTIVLFDYDTVAEAVSDDPDSYGLENVDAGFLTDPDVGAIAGDDPDTFFWWDDFHLTRAAHAIVGKAATKLVSEVFAGPWPPWRSTAGVAAPAVLRSSGRRGIAAGFRLSDRSTGLLGTRT